MGSQPIFLLYLSFLVWDTGWTQSTFPHNDTRIVAFFKDMAINNNKAMRVSVNSAVACVDRCEGTIGCLSVDFAPPSDCRLHLNESCRMPTPRPNTNVYRLFICRPQYLVRGSVMVPNVTTEVGCIEFCRSDNSCVAIDWSRKNSTCYKHTYHTACEMFHRQYQWIHYRRTICPPQAIMKLKGHRYVPLLTNEVGRYIPGGVNHTSQVGIMECIMMCINQESCLAFTFETFGSVCTFHNHTTICNEVLPHRTASHYKFVTCAKESSGSGGSLQPNITNQYNCVHKCKTVNSTKCLAADYDSNTNQCFWHNEFTTCNPLTSRPTVNHFKLRNCTARLTTTVAPTPGPDVFYIKYGINVFGGVPQKNIKSVRDCIRSCWADRGRCKALDFSFKNTSLTSCWHHSEDTACLPTHPLAYNLHVKLENCDQQTGTFAGGKYCVLGNHHILNGIPISKIVTESGCRFACEKAGFGVCQAFDFNYKEQKCYFHSRFTSCGSLIPRQGVNHFSRATCTPGLDRDCSSLVKRKMKPP